MPSKGEYRRIVPLTSGQAGPRKIKAEKSEGRNCGALRFFLYFYKKGERFAGFRVPDKSGKKNGKK
jgi:hypothetical protein